MSAQGRRFLLITLALAIAIALGAAVLVKTRFDDDMRRALQTPGQLFGLPARDGLQWPFVFLVVPDRGVILTLLPRTHGQDDEVQDRPPLPLRNFDDALVR